MAWDTRKLYPAIARKMRASRIAEEGWATPYSEGVRAASRHRRPIRYGGKRKLPKPWVPGCGRTAPGFGGEG